MIIICVNWILNLIHVYMCVCICVGIWAVSGAPWGRSRAHTACQQPGCTEPHWASAAKGRQEACSRGWCITTGRSKREDPLYVDKAATHWSLWLSNYLGTSRGTVALVGWFHWVYEEWSRDCNWVTSSGRSLWPKWGGYDGGSCWWSREKAGILIGADGLHSVIREQLHGNDVYIFSVSTRGRFTDLALIRLKQTHNRHLQTRELHTMAISGLKHSVYVVGGYA